MSLLEPIYKLQNTRFAYQLRWGVTIFWKEPVSENVWLELLSRQLEEQDGIRVLSWRWLDSITTQLAVSTQPTTSPLAVIRRLKGRLQYILRGHATKALRPRYAIRSFGTQERSLIESYISKQPRKHRMADERVQANFEDLLHEDPTVDLTQPQTTEHGLCWHNLHIVLVHQDRWHDVNQKRLQRTRDVVLTAGRKRAWRISRCAIVTDHLHVSLGSKLDDSPASVALSLMNNIAWVHEMKPVLCFSGFLGTIGEYDQRVVSGTRLGP